MATIPLVKNAQSNSDFNNSLLALFSAAGPVPVPGGPAPVIQPGYDINLHLSWFSDPDFNQQVKNELDTIRVRFRPGNNCYVVDNDYSSYPGNYGWLVFPGESSTNTSAAYPSEAARLLLMFRYWNIINYFNPNNDLMDQAWDSTLYQYTLRMANAANTIDYQLSFLEFVAKINDTHAFTATGTTNSYFGNYYPKFRVDYIENKTVVTHTYGNVAVNVGDVITKINGVDADTLRKNFGKYIAASNPASLNRDLNTMLIRGANNTTLALEIQNAGGTSTCSVARNMYAAAYYDSLYAIHGKPYYTLPGCNYGYVNMGLLQPNQVNAMYDSLKNKAAIVFDIRNYPNATAWDICNLMFPNKIQFSKLTVPSDQFPGVLDSYYLDSIGVDNNPAPYTGNVYIVVNQETQSQAEYSAMMLAQHPHAKTFGSQTAGADGNITELAPVLMPFYSYFSTLKVMYPNGTVAQRAGVIIDSVITPTISGTRAGRDEVLEAIVPCILTGISNNVQAEYSLAVFPNPVSNVLIVKGLLQGNRAVLKLTDLLGNRIWEKQIENSISIHETIPVQDLCNGSYLLTVEGARGVQLNKKIVVVHE